MKNYRVKIRNELIIRFYRYFHKTITRKMSINLYEQIYDELQEKIFDQVSVPLFHETRSNLKL